jgi:hypothetical protein
METTTETKQTKVSISILDIFKDEYIETSSAYKMACPHCGLQGGRTEGFILFPDSNTAYCHSSDRHFKLLEAYALKKKIIKCLDGREKGDNKTKILFGELYTIVLEEFKNEFGTDKYNELVEQLNIRMKTELPGNGKLMSDFSDELGDIYKSRNVLFYRPESKNIVEIGRMKNGDGHYIEIGFKIVNGNRFITLVEILIKPWATIFTKNGSMIIIKSMSQTVANQVLESKQFQEKLPVINRIFDIQIPIIHNGKLTFPKRGYDARFNSWLSRNTPDIIDIPLEDAVFNLKNIFKEFPFKNKSDESKAIAGLLTPFLRGLFPSFSTRTPVFVYMANRERSGKDYCANITGLIYEGEAIEEPPICSGDQKGGESDELRKKITASMLQGKKRMHFSNNKGLLNNATFESVTTSEVWHDRILGRNDNIQIANEMDFSLSGNIGLRLTPDMANRSMIINLHLVEENANGRKFKNPYLHQWVRENRSMIVSSLYSLVRNWFDKGCPKGSVAFASFPRWAEVCGGIMEACGFDNPITTDEDAMIPIDSETEDMKILFQSCYEEHPNTYITKQDVGKIADKENIMTYIDFSTKSGQTNFGMKIDKFVERELGGIIMKVDDPKKRASRRKYAFMLNALNSENDIGGNLVACGQPFPTHRLSIYSRVDSIGMDTKGRHVTTLEPSLEQNNGKIDIIPPILSADKVLERFEESNRTMDDVVKDFKDRVKIIDEAKKKHKEKEERVKTDRELQFWESPETKDIVSQCTKEQTLEWVKENLDNNYKDIYKQLGNGSFKHINDLMEEGSIKEKGDGWEHVQE